MKPNTLSLEDQIAHKCIHFNGVMEKTCKAGINYNDVWADKPSGLPCLKQGGECHRAEFPTEEQVKEKVAAIMESGTQTLMAAALIKAHIQKKSNNGIIECVCGSDSLHYAVAETNGHIRAKCNKCGISFVE